MHLLRRLGVSTLGCATLVACVAAEAPDEEFEEASSAQSQRPNFQAPFPCNQSWTYSHHSQEVRLALDFVNTSGATNGAPALASAAGIATQRNQPGGAGKYIVIDHGGGWATYYFHLQSWSVPSGTRVRAGQEIGRVGNTGASSGPHLHYEQLLNGRGQTIVINGQSLGPYPRYYNQRSLRSANCGGGGGVTCPGGSGTVVGKIAEKYKALGGCGSILGVPKSDERGTPDGVGRYTVFDRGSIYWTAALGAFEVHGEIRDKWAKLGWEAGPLGYPITDERRTPDGIGRYNVFERGSIYWTAELGAHEVRGRIRDAWKETGWEAGPLGYPISDEYAVPEGRKSDFEGGSIVWDAKTNLTKVELLADPEDDAGAP